MSVRLMRNSKKVEHELVGYSVSFGGRLWKVISAYQSKSDGSDNNPWLTLKSEMVETVAKAQEVQKVYN